MNCDNCGEEIIDSVYYVAGIRYSCCSLTCLAKLTMTASITTVKEREAYLGE